MKKATYIILAILTAAVGILAWRESEMVERSSPMQAELLLETRAAFRNLDGIKEGASFSGYALQVKDPATGLPQDWQFTAPYSVSCPTRGDGHRTWPEYINPTTYLGGGWATAPVGQFQKCQQCEEDYPGSYNGRWCTQTSALRWSPSPIPPMDFAITEATSPFCIGAQHTVYPIVGSTFHCNLYLLEMTASPTLACLSGNLIKNAWADVQLIGGTTYTDRLVKPKGTLTPTIFQTDSEEGKSNIGVSAVIMRQVGDSWRLIRWGGMGTGVGSLASDEEWHTVDVTTVTRALADGECRQGDRVFWCICGTNPAGAEGGFNGLWRSFLNTYSYKFPSDYGEEGYWYDCEINISVDRTVYTAFVIDNVRFELDWDQIDLTDMAVPFYENWPSPMFAP